MGLGVIVEPGAAQRPLTREEQETVISGKAASASLIHLLALSELGRELVTIEGEVDLENRAKTISARLFCATIQ